MATSRADRVPERVREILAELIGRLKDPRIGFVTVTDVRTTADNSHATVYYTVLGDEDDRERTADGLASASSLLRRELGRRLRVRQTPSLEFVHDPVPEQGRRIEALIEQVHREAESDGGRPDVDRDGVQTDR